MLKYYNKLKKYCDRIPSYTRYYYNMNSFVLNIDNKKSMKY